MKLKMTILIFICLIEIFHPEKVYSKICEQGFSNKELNRKLRSLFAVRENMEIYMNVKGYIRFANDYFDGNMNQAIMRVSYALDTFTFNRLGWRHFYGKVETFQEIRNRVLNSDGSIKEEYKTMDGYVRATEEWFEGRMLDTYISVLGVLGKKRFYQLDWRQFPGTLHEFRQVQDILLDSNGVIKEEYKYMNGYERFTEDYVTKNMYRDFSSVSTVLGSQKFKELGWRQFHGTLEEFRNIKNRVLITNGIVNNEYKGMIGCARLAKEMFFGKMSKAFINVLSVLGRETFDQLGWRQFPGTTTQFYLLQSDFKKYYPWQYIDLEEDKGELPREYFLKIR